jgi:signal peptidase I
MTTLAVGAARFVDCLANFSNGIPLFLFPSKSMDPTLQVKNVLVVEKGFAQIDVFQ